MSDVLKFCEKTIEIVLLEMKETQKKLAINWKTKNMTNQRCLK